MPRTPRAHASPHSEHSGNVSSSEGKRLQYAATGDLAKTAQVSTVSLVRATLPTHSAQRAHADSAQTLPRPRVAEFVALAQKTISFAGGAVEVQLQELSTIDLSDPTTR